MESDSVTAQQWSMRRPQRYVFTVVVVVLMVAVIATGFGFISGGEGGVVPFLMILVAPVLGIFYIWYFNFSEFARGDTSQDGSAELPPTA
jgi:hypothetical protein